MTIVKRITCLSQDHLRSKLMLRVYNLSNKLADRLDNSFYEWCDFNWRSLSRSHNILIAEVTQVLNIKSLENTRKAFYQNTSFLFIIFEIMKDVSRVVLSRYRWKLLIRDVYFFCIWFYYVTTSPLKSNSVLSNRIIPNL